MVPLMLVAAAVLGATLVFGYSSFVVGLVLMAVGVFGLIAYVGERGEGVRK